MNKPKVLLMQLEERTSANGNRYLSGWLGKARLVGFLDRDAPDGKTVWQVYAQEPEDRSGAVDQGQHRAASTTRQNRPEQQHRRAAQPVPSGVLDDRVSW